MERRRTDDLALECTTHFLHGRTRAASRLRRCLPLCQVLTLLPVLSPRHSPTFGAERQMLYIRRQRIESVGARRCAVAPLSWARRGARACRGTDYGTVDGR